MSPMADKGVCIVFGGSMPRLSFLALLVSLLAGCFHQADEARVSDTGYFRPALGDRFAIQLLVDEANPLRDGLQVDVMELDLFDTPASVIADLQARGVRVACYFSAGSWEEWRADAAEFPDAIIGNSYDGWSGERWLDIRAAALRPLLEARLDLARDKGCDGVDPDNVNGYSVDTGFEISAEDQLIFNRWLAEAAHERGLFVILKNDGAQAGELVGYFDAVVTEQCDAFDECDLYLPFIEAGKPVWDLEYRQDRDYDDPAVFQAMCRSTQELGVQAAYYPMALDGSFRYPCDPVDALENGFTVGLGDRSSMPLQRVGGGEPVWLRLRDLILEDGVSASDEAQAVANLDAAALDELDARLDGVDWLSLWVVPGWAESWYDPEGLADLLRSGVGVVLNYWYFGDRLLEEWPDAQARAAYLDDAARLGRFLATLPAPVVVNLEPEFNKPLVLDHAEEFVDLMEGAMDAILTHAPETRLMITLTDTGDRDAAATWAKCGYDRCSLGDRYAWSRFDTVLEPLMDRLDYLGFQEMVAQFSRDPADPGGWDTPRPRAFPDTETGIDDLPERILNFTRFLHERWGKPVIIPYLAIATAVWSDADGDGEIDPTEVDPSGWEPQAETAWKAIIARRDELAAAGLRGIAPMLLLDDPAHDQDGYQFFLDNEYHLGVVASGAEAGVDAYPDGALRPKGGILAALFP